MGVITFNVRIFDDFQAGQESFRSIVKTFYKNSAAVLLVYDVTAYNISNIANLLTSSKDIAIFF